MTRILVLQGANMDRMGKRDPEIYGTTTSAQIDEMIRAHAKAKGIEVEIFYTNGEGDFIDRLKVAEREGVSGVVSNPGSFCYNSYSIRDAFGATDLPVVEVHLSNQLARGIHSVTSTAAEAVILGLGPESYLLGIDAALRLLGQNEVA